MVRHLFIAAILNMPANRLLSAIAILGLGFSPSTRLKNCCLSASLTGVAPPAMAA
jgi:hypothetical protein